MVRRAKWARKKHRSIDTASKIISIRKAHPDWSLPEIGQELNVTKQRVFYVLKTAELQTKGRTRITVFNYCPSCHMLLPPKRKVCREPKCHLNFYYLKVTCSFCHIDFYRKKSILKKCSEKGYRFIYCSNICKHRGYKRYVH